LTAALEDDAGAASPPVAIDVAEIGGMYAKSIRLIGTEAGVGVRNAGHIGASAGQLVVTADGRLENTGNLVASGNVVIETASALQNSGQVLALQNVAVKAATTADNTGGRIAAAQHATVRSQDLINLGGTIEAGDTLEIDAEHIANSGLIDARALRLDAVTLENHGNGRIFGDKLAID
ncbi:hypothetical protein V6O07_01945, partial [Arthrospira platensis SPKY2]